MIDQNYQYQDRINDSGSGFGAKHPDKKRKLKAGQKIQVLKMSYGCGYWKGE